MAVSDWKLERLLLGDLSPEEKRAVLRELDLEEGGRERLEAMRSSTGAILERYPPRVMGLSFRSEAEQPERAPRRSRGWVLAPVLMVAAALLVAVPVWMSTPTDDGYVGVKGSPRLVATLRQDEGSTLLTNGDVVGEGDVVQLSYVAMGARHGVILSVDGAGVTTLHFPLPGRTTRLNIEGTTHLDAAYRLDAAPDFERFFLVTSDAPLDVEAVLESARRLVERGGADAADLPDIGSQSSLLVRKSP